MDFSTTTTSSITVNFGPNCSLSKEDIIKINNFLKTTSIVVPKVSNSVAKKNAWFKKQRLAKKERLMKAKAKINDIITQSIIKEAQFMEDANYDEDAELIRASHESLIYNYEQMNL